MSHTLGRYRLIAELGRGGMGIVYLAIPDGRRAEGDLLVIKRLKPHLADDQTFTRMFVEEARLAARLDHPNIVKTFEVLCENDEYLMVMEYVDGPTLRGALRRLRVSDAATAQKVYLRAILDTLSALSCAHDHRAVDGRRASIIHRDVSPHNILLTYDGQAKLLDFGIAKANDSPEKTRVGVLKGKPGYMSPEQVSGRDIDTRSDLFAVGVMLWDALVGRRLWEGMSDGAVFAALFEGAIVAPSAAGATIPSRLEAICMRALACDPHQRYQTAAEFRQDLAAQLESAGMLIGQRDAARFVASVFDEERKRRGVVIRGALAKMGNVAPVLRDSSSLPTSTASIVTTLPATAYTRSTVGRRPGLWGVGSSRVAGVVAACGLLGGLASGALVAATGGGTVGESVRVSVRKPGRVFVCNAAASEGRVVPKGH